KIYRIKLYGIVFIILAILCARHIHCALGVFHSPSYSKEDITHIIDSKNVSDTDLEFVFRQTGVSPQIARDLINSQNTDLLLKLNEKYFAEPENKRNYIFFPLTAEERNTASATELVPVKNGDILITFNTHTCDWRHGHAAIVTNAEKGEILEHKSVGNVSELGNIRQWGSYPSFVVLRYPDDDLAQKASTYARENLVGIEYNIFAGVVKKDKSDEKTPSSSHCSHIVWQAYKSQGVDIDQDKGIIVTPHDIAMSDKLSVVQIFGLDLASYQSRIMK
ncbi:MAG: hypothetical protein IKA95_03695, partial [Clostridia bacterium]|nr:hypothetical protein [Clostridia bacterium]